MKENNVAVAYRYLKNPNNKTRKRALKLIKEYKKAQRIKGVMKKEDRQ
jgi:hypothetical protein